MRTTNITMKKAIIYTTIALVAVLYLSGFKMGISMKGECPIVIGYCGKINLLQ